MSDKYHPVIGIDLGTTYSAVAVFNRFEEQTEIIPNAESIDNQGRRRSETTPSVISLDPQTRKVIVGWPAKRNYGEAQNTVIEIKREMGDVFRETTLDLFAARGVYRAREERPGGYEGDPVRVQFNGEWYLPQEISAFTLMKMKEVAEAHIGEPIRDAVITVPAYFTEKQRKATEEAAYLAGLYPRQLIPEPTAAAICYGVDRLEAERKTYLVYDLGGGTFDVSIISVEGTQISALATSGDPRLGGGDFDDCIVRWALEELRTRFQLDPAGDREKLARIKAHAEQAKKDLSTQNVVTMSLIDVWPQQPPSLELTRQKFEELIEPLLNKSLTFVDAALKQAETNRGLRREDLDAILLVGGSTKIPRVKALLLAHFQQDEAFVSVGLNPDEVVARGAATLALKFAPTPGEFNIAKRPSASLVNTDMADDLGIDLITEHSLGVGVQNNLVSRIIDQGTSIPVARRQGGFTNGGPTEHVDVPVYQGEGQYSYQNTLIGTLRIGPMEPKPEGTHQFEVTFSLDDNGLLSMTVHHINEGKNYQAQFEQRTGVGGPEALMARGTKLASMYGGKIAKPAGPAVAMPAQPVSPGIPQPAGNGGYAAGSPGAAVGGWTPGAPVAPGAPVMPGAPVAPGARVMPGAPVSPGATRVAAPIGAAAEAVAVAPAAPAAQPAPMPQPAAAQPATAPVASSGVLEPTVEVPSEFKSIVRRAQKKVAESANDKLRVACNRFIELLNSGAPSDQLEEAGDELADVYHDCR